VSDAADLARFYQALLRNDAGLWDPDVLADASANVRNTFPDPQTGVPANRALSVVVAGHDGKAGMRGLGYTCSPAAFGHNGAGGQIAWGDPATGVSFCWFTNGLDRHLIRQWRRSASIASKAGSVVPVSN
jgi:CubicO group peptidase (beta-lactamase class C family)